MKKQLVLMPIGFNPVGAYEMENVVCTNFPSGNFRIMEVSPGSVLVEFEDECEKKILRCADVWGWMPESG